MISHLAGRRENRNSLKILLDCEKSYWFKRKSFAETTLLLILCPQFKLILFQNFVEFEAKPSVTQIKL